MPCRPHRPLTYHPATTAGASPLCNAPGGATAPPGSCSTASGCCEIVAPVQPAPGRAGRPAPGAPRGVRRVRAAPRRRGHRLPRRAGHARLAGGLRPRPGRRRAARSKGADLIGSGAATHVFNPGGGLHHAHRGADAGFCIFNDVALAVHRLRRGLRPDPRGGGGRGRAPRRRHAGAALRPAGADASPCTSTTGASSPAPGASTRWAGGTATATR